MVIDDPAKPEFGTWDSYNRFAQLVRHSRRYVWSIKETGFLSTVLATVRDRDVFLLEGMVLYRAQLGIEWEEQTDEDGKEDGEEPVGFSASRMKPRVNRANEGRANPAGIPVLYLGTTEQTAISEVRPWVGASVSVAQFKTLKRLKALDLSRGHGKSSFSEIGFGHLFGGDSPSADAKEKAVWIDIDNAFSRPVTPSDDRADYVPTQILAELFRDAGYEAIVYKSQFGKKGFNVAIFNIDDADILNCAPYEVSEIEVKFRQFGNPWFATKYLPSTGDDTSIGTEFSS